MTPAPGSPRPPSTHRLLIEAKGGGGSAREELFTRLRPRVRRIVALRMGCRESDLWDREDLVQESLLEAFRGLETFADKREGALAHWLATIVQNNLTDHRRRRKARRRDAGRVVHLSDPPSRVLSESVLGVDPVTPGDHAEAAELEERLERALLALGDRERRVIELRNLCEFSFDEIAKELGLKSASSARSLFTRARVALSKRL